MVLSDKKHKHSKIFHSSDRKSEEKPPQRKLGKLKITSEADKMELTQSITIKKEILHQRQYNTRENKEEGGVTIEVQNTKQGSFKGSTTRIASKEEV